MFDAVFLGWIFCSAALSVFCGALFMRIFSAVVSTATRQDTPARHRLKGKVPTMGGIFVLIAVVCAVLLSGFYSERELLVVAAIIGCALVGLWDDLAKIMKGKGISERQKLVGQVIVASLVIGALVVRGWLSTMIVVPFVDLSYNVGLFFIPWAVWVIVGTSNAVNLTDGLDGLASVCLIPNFMLFGLFLSVQGLWMTAFLAFSFVAALCGFLCFNWHPARVFMGDVGALAFGAALALCALLAKSELVLPLSGLIFVVETASVIVQVAYYKCYKQRIFKMTPIHHHYELSGYSEQQIVMGAGSISVLLCACLGVCVLVL